MLFLVPHTKISERSDQHSLLYKHVIKVGHKGGLKSRLLRNRFNVWLSNLDAKTTSTYQRRFLIESIPNLDTIDLTWYPVFSMAARGRGDDDIVT